MKLDPQHHTAVLNPPDATSASRSLVELETKSYARGHLLPTTGFFYRPPQGLWFFLPTTFFAMTSFLSSQPCVWTSFIDQLRIENAFCLLVVEENTTATGEAAGVEDDSQVDAKAGFTTDSYQCALRSAR
jgi:hypothetical protein